MPSFSAATPARPSFHLSIRIRHLPLGKAASREILAAHRRTGKLGSAVQAVDRKRLALGVMGYFERRNDAEPLVWKCFGPFQEADGIVECVMLPIDASRLRFDPQHRTVQAQIVLSSGRTISRWRNRPTGFR